MVTMPLSSEAAPPPTKVHDNAPMAAWSRDSVSLEKTDTVISGRRFKGSRAL